MLVVALGADLDTAATPGLAEAGHEFYTEAGAEALRDALPSFDAGTAIVGVCGTPFKCPPAPSEAAILLDEHVRERGVRDDVRIQVVIPFSTPVPPSPATSEAILATFAERGIEFVAERKVAALDPATNEAVLDDGRRLPFDLFLGIPVHRAPAVVEDSGLAVDGWIPVDQETLATRFVAEHLIARIRGTDTPAPYDGTGSCYIEFGNQGVGRVDVDFFSTPGHPTGTFVAPSAETTAEKLDFASGRRARWFGP